MKSILFILYLLFLLTCKTFAQSPDLLDKEKKIAQLIGEAKVLLMIEVAEAYLSIDANKSLKLTEDVEEMIGKPSKKNYKEGVMLSDTYYISGDAYLSLLDYKNAEKAFVKSFNTANKFDYTYGKNKAEKMLNDLGVSTGNWFDRQLNTLSNLGIDEKLKDVKSDIQEVTKDISAKEKEVRMEKYIKLGDTAIVKRDYKQAITHYQRATAISKTIEKPHTTLNLYLTLANLSEKNKSLPKAINYYDSALQYIQSHPVLSTEVRVTDSIQQLKKTLQTLEQPIVKSVQKDTLQRQKVDSLIQLENAISLNLKNQEESKVKMASLQEVAEKSEAAGDYEKALQFKEMYFAMQSRLFQDSLENVARIGELEKGRKLQAVELKSQAELLEKEKNTKILFITSSVLLGMLALVSFYFFRNKKKSHNELETAYSELENTLKALKVAQLKLIESEKMASLGQLTAGIAHEINNPINFVTSNIAPLKRDLEDLRTFYNAFEQCAANNEINMPASLVNLRNELDLEFLMEEMNSLLNGIEEGAGRTKTIVENFRSFARLDEEGYKKADIKKSILASVNLLQNKAGDAIDFKMDFPDEAICECQPAKINQVFFHMLHNAVQAILERKDRPASPAIEIGVSNEAGEIQINIKDNGIGIPKDIMPKIFDPFFTTRDIGEGKGLGLSIAYGIIQEHNGSITFDTKTGEGAFTEFIVTLPIKQEIAADKSLSKKLVDV